MSIGCMFFASLYFVAMHVSYWILCTLCRTVERCNKTQWICRRLFVSEWNANTRRRYWWSGNSSFCLSYRSSFEMVLESLARFLYFSILQCRIMKICIQNRSFGLPCFWYLDGLCTWRFDNDAKMIERMWNSDWEFCWACVFIAAVEGITFHWTEKWLHFSWNEFG